MTSPSAPLRFLTMHFYTARTDANAASTAQAIDPLIVRTTAELPEAMRAHAHAVEHARRLAAGHAALLVMAGDAVMHASWIARRTLRVDELACTLALPDDAICVYDVVTSDAWRGRGVYPAVLTWMREHARHHFGAGVVWIYSEANNTASRRGIEKAGYAPAGVRRACVVADRWRCSWGRVNGELSCV